MWKWSKGILIGGSARTIVEVQCSHIATEVSKDIIALL